MKVGNQVTWSSHSRFTRKTKTGVLIAVVPAKANLAGLVARKVSKRKFDISPIRNSVSKGVVRLKKTYLVAVKGRDKKTKVYWPRIENLSLA